MTREQKLEAYGMRLDGCTYQEIADKFGVTKQYIQQSLFPSDGRMSKIRNSEICIYAGLAQFIDDHNVTQRKLAEVINTKCPQGNSTRLRRKITGETQFKINEIYKILKFTGMTFEECFALKKSEVKENE